MYIYIIRSIILFWRGSLISLHISCDAYKHFTIIIKSMFAISKHPHRQFSFHIPMKKCSDRGRDKVRREFITKKKPQVQKKFDKKNNAYVYH